VLMSRGLHGGATVVTLPRFDLARYLRVHQEHGVTRAYVAPPIVLAPARHPMVRQYDLSSLRKVTSGAAPLSADPARAASARLGCEVVQGYGMTELSPVSHTTPAGDFVPGSVGVGLPDTETRIVDPATGEDAEEGADGEIWVRGPQVMKGYRNNPVATALTLDDQGWLHTGDIGHVGAGGHLFVVDRLKELIKVSGFQVPPAELEALLLSHPAIADAAVVGMPDDATGEAPVGYVALRPGRSCDGCCATARRLRGSPSPDPARPRVGLRPGAGGSPTRHRERARTSVRRGQCAEVSAQRSVRGLVRGADLAGHAAPVAHLETVLARPRPHVGQVGALGGGAALRRREAGAAGGAATHPASVTHPGRERGPNGLRIGRGDVDLVADAVEGEAQRLVGLAAVDIVDEDDLHLLGHGVS